MNRNQELGAIASNVHALLRSFQNLANPLTGDAGSSSLHRILNRFEDETTRFKMWSGNLGAHQSGRASLDHRLREAPHLQEQVIYLLKDLCESLQDALALVSHEPPSWHRDPHSADDEDETASLGQSSDSGFSDSDDDDGSPEAGLSTIYTDVGEAIDCLLRLSVAIANPAPHERVRKLGTGPDEDVSFYETHDISYVRDKFPKMSDEMVEMLGKSVTRRRQFFKYREAHHARLAAGLEGMSLNREADTSRTEIVPKTIASSLPDFLKNLANVDLRAGVIDEDGRSEMGMSQTSYATSAGFVDGHVQKPPPPLKVPPLPAAAERGSFECPFCYRMVSASTWGAWKRHVFGDLRPYTCLFSGCVESNTDFDRRHRWQLHISQYHWRSWFCPFKCEGTFPSAMELRDHISHQHLPSAPEEQLNAVTALGEKATSDDTANKCPLCPHTVVGLKPYVKHVGRHLEQLALFALPNLEDEDLEYEGESDEQNSAASEVQLGDANSSDGSSTSPSLRRRLQEPVAVFVEGIWNSDEVERLKDANDEKRAEEQVTEEADDQDARGEEEAAAAKAGIPDAAETEAHAVAEVEGPTSNEFGDAARHDISTNYTPKFNSPASTPHLTPVADENDKAEEERVRKHAEAMRQVKEKVWLKFEAELKAAELARKRENEARALVEEEAKAKFVAEMRAAEEAGKRGAEARVRAEAEAKAKFEAEMRAAEARGKKEAEERARAEVEARRRFEAELKAAEEMRKKEEEAKARAEEMARIRLETALKAEAAAKASYVTDDFPEPWPPKGHYRRTPQPMAFPFPMRQPTPRPIPVQIPPPVVERIPGGPRYPTYRAIPIPNPRRPKVVNPPEPNGKPSSSKKRQDSSWIGFLTGKPQRQLFRSGKNLADIADHDVSLRYAYGEIRLTRLNLYAPLLLGRSHFQRVEYQYGTYFSRFFGPILFIMGLASVVLSGLQVVVSVGEDGRGCWTGAAFWISVMAIVTSCGLLFSLGFLLVYKVAKEWKFAIRDRLRLLEERQVTE